MQNWPHYRQTSNIYIFHDANINNNCRVPAHVEQQNIQTTNAEWQDVEEALITQQWRSKNVVNEDEKLLNTEPQSVQLHNVICQSAK